MEEMNECLGAIMAKYLAGEASVSYTHLTLPTIA